jgi:O-antigen ligase
MTFPGQDARPASARAATFLLLAFLFVLPFSSSAALRNGLLAAATTCALYGVATNAMAGPRLPSWRVLAPIAAYCAWCIASVSWSVDPAYSISELRPGLLYPFVAFLVFHAVTTGAAEIDLWAWSLSAGLAALGAAAVAQLVMAGWWEPGHWHGDAGFYATHVLLAAPLLAWLFLRSGPVARGRQAMLAAVAVLTLYVMSWNDNRIGWVALAAMTTLAVALSWQSLPGRDRTRILGVSALAMLAFAILFLASLEQRTARLAGTPHAAEAQLAHDPRPAIWDYAARRHGDAPLAGHGYGRGILQYDFRMFVTPGVDNPKHAHAHNTALNVLLQGGLAGMALFAWMVVALVREMAAGLAAGARGRAIATLGLVLVAGFAIRNMTDDFLVRHNALLAWSLAGAVLGALRPTSARTPA